MRDLIKPVSEVLEPVLSEMGLAGFESKSLIGPATDKSHGDLAIPCHQFARILKRSPVEIADEAAEKMNFVMGKLAKLLKTKDTCQICVVIWLTFILIILVLLVIYT